MYGLVLKWKKITIENKIVDTCASSKDNGSEKRRQTSKNHAWTEAEEKIQLKEKISNQELARFFDNVLFVVYTFVYAVVIMCFTITLEASGWACE